MKLQARIAEGVDVKVDNHPQSIIVEFTEDKSSNDLKSCVMTSIRTKSGTYGN